MKTNSATRLASTKGTRHSSTLLGMELEGQSQDRP